MKNNFLKSILTIFLMIFGSSVFSSPYISSTVVNRDIIFDDHKLVNIWTSLIVDNETADSYMVHVKGDGQTVMFNGLLQVQCGINKSTWFVGRNWLNGKYKESDVEVVPKKVISLIQKKYCSK